MTPVLPTLILATTSRQRHLLDMRDLPRRGRRARSQRGFSLIELMIVVLIVAVLAAIALPSYRQYVLRSHRAEAKSALLNVAAAQERHYLQNNTYTTNLTAAPGDSPAGLGIADSSSAAGVQTENGWYTIAVTSADATAFTVTATAIGSQASDTKCTSFTLTSAGVKSATGSASGECWEK